MTDSCLSIGEELVGVMPVLNAAQSCKPVSLKMRRGGEQVRLALADSVALAAPKTMCDIARAEDLHKRAAQAAREAVLRRQRAWAAAGEASEGEAAAGEAGSQSGSEASHSARGPKLPGNVAGFLGGLEKVRNGGEEPLWETRRAPSLRSGFAMRR